MKIIFNKIFLFLFIMFMNIVLITTLVMIATYNRENVFMLFLERHQEELSKKKYIQLNEKHILVLKDWSQYLKCQSTLKTKLIEEVICEKDY